jgi:hypothetical protein
MEELDVVFPKELELYFEICAFTSVNVPTTSTMLATNSTTTYANQQWATLAKQQDFWKVQSQNATTWAFFVPNSSSSSEVSSTSNQTEHLKCLLCGPIALGVGSRKGIITYKTMNGISTVSKHLDLLHRQLWNEWVDWEKDGFNAIKRPFEKRFGLTLLSHFKLFF